MLVDDTTCALVAAAPPKDTAAPTRMSAPVIVTLVPPAVGPVFGDTLASVGGFPLLNEKPAVSAPICPSGLVTTTSTTPAACASVVAVIDVAVMVPIVAATPPIVTVAPAANALPPIVTSVPPAIVPKAGVMDTGAGGAMKVNAAGSVATCVSLFVTVTATVPAAC